MATWIHHFTGHGNPSIVQDWAPKTNDYSKYAQLSATQSSGKGNFEAHSEGYQTWPVLANRLCRSPPSFQGYILTAADSFSRYGTATSIHTADGRELTIQRPFLR